MPALAERFPQGRSHIFGPMGLIFAEVFIILASLLTLSYTQHDRTVPHPWARRDRPKLPR